jgi:hypothetical protein
MTLVKTVNLLVKTVNLPVFQNYTNITIFLINVAESVYFQMRSLI